MKWMQLSSKIPSTQNDLAKSTQFFTQAMYQTLNSLTPHIHVPDHLTLI